MTIEREEILEWLTLQFIPGLGDVGCKNLIHRFGSAQSVLRATLGDLAGVEGVREEVARRILKRKTTANPAEILRGVEKHGARILRITDPEYPASLREIHDPPLLLYAKGKSIPATVPFIAIVGSRNPTHYGIGAAEKIGQGLGKRRVGVVSGMARGIDSAAHWGSIEGDGFPLAVLGTGIDVIYPDENAPLYQKIVERGAVVTQFPPGTPPDPWNFPHRNRIISGISRAVVVVEATMKSGSLITASLALEQGREVFAVPGSVDSFKSAGCHFLIKQGARLVENADDILKELGIGEGLLFRDRKPTIPFPLLEDGEIAIYDMLSDYPIHVDEIVRKRGMQAGEVLSALLRMELKGLVRQLPGKMFIR